MKKLQMSVTVTVCAVVIAVLFASNEARADSNEASAGVELAGFGPNWVPGEVDRMLNGRRRPMMTNMVGHGNSCETYDCTPDYDTCSSKNDDISGNPCGPCRWSSMKCSK